MTNTRRVSLVAFAGLALAASVGIAGCSSSSSSPDSVVPASQSPAAGAIAPITSLPQTVSVSPSEKIFVELEKQSGTGMVWVAHSDAGITVAKVRETQPQQAGGDVEDIFQVTPSAGLSQAKVAFSLVPVSEASPAPQTPTGPGSGYLTISTQ